MYQISNTILRLINFKCDVILPQRKTPLCVVLVSHHCQLTSFKMLVEPIIAFLQGQSRYCWQLLIFFNTHIPFLSLSEKIQFPNICIGWLNS